MRNTYMEKPQNLNREWYVVDATGMTLGRLSAAVSAALIGKHKPIYTPHIDCGDNIIIINAEKIVLTGNKMKDKKYYRHTGHPGGLKEESAEKLLARKPERMLELAIKGMLPKNRLGRDMYRKLYVYAGNEHPHTAQSPKELGQDVRNWFVR